jgi:hypothetical protein
VRGGARWCIGWCDYPYSAWIVALGWGCIEGNHDVSHLMTGPTIQILIK